MRRSSVIINHPIRAFGPFVGRGVALPSSTRHRDRRRSAAGNVLSPNEAGPAATELQ